MKSNKQENISLRACGYNVKKHYLRRLEALHLAVKKFGYADVKDRLTKLGRYHAVMMMDDKMLQNVMSEKSFHLSKYGYRVNGRRSERLYAILDAIKEYDITVVAWRLMELGKFHPVMIEDLKNMN